MAQYQGPSIRKPIESDGEIQVSRADWPDYALFMGEQTKPATSAPTAVLLATELHRPNKSPTVGQRICGTTDGYVGVSTHRGDDAGEGGNEHAN